MRRTLSALFAPVVLIAAVGLALTTGAESKPRAVAKRPNIVFILTDDLSWNLVTPRYAPHIIGLERRGETFTHYYVADSLCCPSRATIFTGLFPHDTHVLTNLPPTGGFRKFQSQGLDRKTFAVTLRSAGYLTSMMGKYLNGYGDPQMTGATAPVPPGWSDWHVSNHTGYKEFNHLLNDNGTFNFYGGLQNYGVDVLNTDARSFIGRAGRKPFFAEVATFAPHAPYTPAPRNANDFPGLTEPRDPSFNTANTSAPSWLAKRKPLSPQRVAVIDASYRRRAQAVEAVDKLVADVEGTLAARHELSNTYIVFSSDNGYHLGQHQLTRGKRTAFETDIRVPLIVAGPGVPHHRVVPQVVQNVDLYPTFLKLAGRTPRKAVDGHSLVPLLHPAGPRLRWPTVALVEQTANGNNPADPDAEGGRAGGAPPTYKAIRISTRQLRGFARPVEAVYVEYSTRETEYYDISRDPFERHNIAARLKKAQRAELHRILVRLTNCHGAAACWAAAMPR